MSRPIQIARDIVPIAQLKTHLSQAVRRVRAQGRPIVITQNGKPAAVLLSPEEFDRLSYHARFVDAVQRGLDDLDGGRVVDDAAVRAALDERLGRLQKKR